VVLDLNVSIATAAATCVKLSLFSGYTPPSLTAAVRRMLADHLVAGILLRAAIAAAEGHDSTFKPLTVARQSWSGLFHQEPRLEIVAERDWRSFTFELVRH
jgi:hypothetical protein